MFFIMFLYRIEHCKATLINSNHRGSKFCAQLPVSCCQQQHAYMRYITPLADQSKKKFNMLHFGKVEYHWKTMIQ